MSGNVWEWVSDWFSSTYYGTYSPDAWPSDPVGPITETHKAVRGGGWINGWDQVRVAFRKGILPDSNVYVNVGFRCAATKPDP